MNLSRGKLLVLIVLAIVSIAAIYYYRTRTVESGRQEVAEQIIPTEHVRHTIPDRPAGKWIPSTTCAWHYIPDNLPFAVVGDTIIFSCDGGLAYINYRAKELAVQYLGDTEGDYVVLAMATDDTIVYCATRQGILCYDPVHNCITDIYRPGEHGLEISNNLDMIYDPWEKCLWVSGFVSFEKATIQRLKLGQNEWEDFFPDIKRTSGATTLAFRPMHAAPTGLIFPFSSNDGCPGGLLFYERNSQKWQYYGRELAPMDFTGQLGRIDFDDAVYDGTQCWFLVGIDVDNERDYKTVGFDMATRQVTHQDSHPQQLPGLKAHFPRIQGVLMTRRDVILNYIIPKLDLHGQFACHSRLKYSTYTFSGDYYAYVETGKVTFFNATGQRLVSIASLRKINSVLGSVGNTLLLQTSRGVEWFDCRTHSFTTVRLPSEVYRYDGSTVTWRVNNSFLSIVADRSVGDCLGRAWSFVIQDGATVGKMIALPPVPYILRYGMTNGHPAIVAGIHETLYEYRDGSWRPATTGSQFSEGVPPVNAPGVRVNDAGLWLPWALHGGTDGFFDCRARR